MTASAVLPTCWWMDVLEVVCPPDPSEALQNRNCASGTREAVALTNEADGDSKEEPPGRAVHVVEDRGWRW